MKNGITVYQHEQRGCYITGTQLRSMTNPSKKEISMYSGMSTNTGSNINIDKHKYGMLSMFPSAVTKRLSTVYRTVCTGVAACAILAAFTTTASAGTEFEIHKNSVKYDGKHYFRMGSHEIELGSYGKKLTPVTGANGLDPDSSFRPLLKGNWKVSEKVTATDDRSMKVKISGELTDITGLLGLSSDDYVELIKSNRCVFRPVFVKDINKFVSALNKDKKNLNNIDDNKSRIVTEVLVVKQCELTEKMMAKHEGKFSGTIEGLVLKVNSSVEKESSGEIILAKGSVIGYMLREPKWDKKAGKNVKKLKDLNLDQHGLK